MVGRICTVMLILFTPVVFAANLNWDKDNSHVGKNLGIPDGREGGETIATAFIINSLPYTDTGNTSDNIDDYDEVCFYGGSTSPDVVYAYTPHFDLEIDIDLCFSLYDTKVYVYEGSYSPGAPYACNDDYYTGDPCGAFVSAIFDLQLSAETIYYIVIDGYGGDSGDYHLSITAHGASGGETLATATEISGLPYFGSGNTCSYVNDYDEVCPYTGSLSRDCVYTYTPDWSEQVDIDLCGSLYDSKVYVYEDVYTQGAPYACNDDYYFDTEPCGLYVSAIFDLLLRGGHQYFIVVDGYNGDCGDYILRIEDHDPVFELVVYPSGTGLYPTIQDGVNGVADGGTVWLADGTFSGPGNNGVYCTGREVTIRSQCGNPEDCVIQSSSLAEPSYPHKLGRTPRCEFRGKRPEAAGGRDLPRDNWGMVMWGGESSASGIRDITFIGATEGALFIWFSEPAITNCRFIGNTSASGSAINFWDGGSQVETCEFTGNMASDSGGAVYALECQVKFRDCLFTENIAFSNGGAVYLKPSSSVDQDSEFRNCVFSGNQAVIGGAIAQWSASAGAEVFIQNCTFSENGAGTGSAIGLESGDMRLWTSILAFNDGAAAVECDSPTNLDVACTNIFGNPGGDWVDCMEPFAGTQANFCLGPEYCGILGTGLYTLQSDSPCAPANSPCGLLVGALPVDCGESSTAATTWSALKKLY